MLTPAGSFALNSRCPDGLNSEMLGQRPQPTNKSAALAGRWWRQSKLGEEARHVPVIAVGLDLAALAGADRRTPDGEGLPCRRERPGRAIVSALEDPLTPVVVVRGCGRGQIERVVVR